MSLNGGKNPGKPSSATSAASCGSTPGFCGEGGKESYKDDVVEVKTGVDLKKNGKATSYSDAIAIKVNCTKNPHVVQFIYREIIGADGKPKTKTMKTTGGKYKTTTDPDNPVWNTDSAAKPSSYYEAGGASRTDPGSLTIFDQPFLTPGTGETWRATFKSYLICDGKVLREVTWVRTQKDGGAPEYSVSVTKTDKLPDWADKQLKDQGYDAAP